MEITASVDVSKISNVELDKQSQTTMTGLITES